MSKNDVRVRNMDLLRFLRATVRMVARTVVTIHTTRVTRPRTNRAKPGAYLQIEAMPTTSASGGPTTVYATAHSRNRQGTAKVAVVSLAILLGACTVESSQSASQHPVTGSESEQSVAPVGVSTVTIRNRSFGAPEITVALGKVTFINADTVPHTVTEGQDGVAAPNARFDMVVGVGGSILVTFVEPGDYRITCLFHSEMHLLVHAG